MRLRRKGTAPSPAAEARRAIELLLDCPHALPAAENAWLLAHLRATGAEALLERWERHTAAPVVHSRCSFCGCFVSTEALAAFRRENQLEHISAEMFRAEEREYDA